jgi:hypothetical protein
VSRDPEDVDHATLDLDYEQHVEPLERDGIDGEEVRCEDACRLGAEKLRSSSGRLVAAPVRARGEKGCCARSLPRP